MGFRAARLNYNIIDIYQPSTVRNDYGELVLTYVKVIETKAMVDFITGDSITQNQALQNSYIVCFTIRNYHEVKDDYIILWKNNKYNIDYIEDDIIARVKKIKCSKFSE